MFKRNEDKYLEAAKQHIAETYEGHYVNDHNIQAIDLWEAQGSLLTTARDAVEKYMMRFGKKDGYNLNDMYKAIHYITLMIHCAEQKQNNVGQAQYDEGIRSGIISDMELPIEPLVY